eukprot:gene15558-23519_t
MFSTASKTKAGRPSRAPSRTLNVEAVTQMHGDVQRVVWVFGPKMSSRRYAFGMVYLPGVGAAGAVMVAGGETGGCKLLGSVEFYDVERKVWEPRQGMQTAGHHVKLMFLPTVTGMGRVMAVRQGISESYDIKGNVWKITTMMTPDYAGFGLVYVPGADEGVLMVAGGYRCDNGCTEIDSVGMYDITANIRIPKTNMRTARKYHAMAFLPHVGGGAIIVAGGQSNSESLDSVEIYNIKTNDWKESPKLNVKRSKFALCFVLSTMQVAIMGGIGGKTPPTGTTDDAVGNDGNDAVDDKDSTAADANSSALADGSADEEAASTPNANDSDGAEPDGSTSKNSSAGTIAAIAGGFVAVLCLVVGVVSCMRKKTSNEEAPAPAPAGANGHHQTYNNPNFIVDVNNNGFGPTYDNAINLAVHVEDPYAGFFDGNTGSGMYSRVVIDDYATISADEVGSDGMLDPANNRFARNLTHALTSRPEEYVALLNSAVAAAASSVQTIDDLPPSEIVRAAITAAAQSCGDGKADADLILACIAPALTQGMQLYQMQVTSGTPPNVDLTPTDIAVIHFYTLHTKLYSAVNHALRRLQEDPEGAGFIEALLFFPYINLLMTALRKLPVVKNVVVFRGIKLPMAKLFGATPIRDKHRFIWPSFTSTTLSSKVLRSPDFLGDGAHHGERTAFQICAVEGRSISAYSYFGANGGGHANGGVNEEEVLLLPGACFETEARRIVRHTANKVTEVKAQQLKTTKLPRSKAAANASCGSAAAAASPYEDLYAVVGSVRAEPVYASVAADGTPGHPGGNFVYQGLWWQPVDGAQRRSRANTNWAERCARGQQSGGKKCNNRAVSGGKYCKGHTCPHDGCTHSKSNTDAICADHAPLPKPPPPPQVLNAGGGFFGGGGSTMPKAMKLRGNQAHVLGKYGFAGGGGGGGIKAGVSVYGGFEEDEEV